MFIITVSSGYLIPLAYYLLRDDCCKYCESIWQRKKENGSVDEYIQEIYDSPPLLKLSFVYGKHDEKKSDSNTYFTKIKYGSWEPYIGTDTLPHKRSTVVVKLRKCNYEDAKGVDESIQTKINLINKFLPNEDNQDMITEGPSLEYNILGIDEDDKFFSTSFCVDLGSSDEYACHCEDEDSSITNINCFLVFLKAFGLNTLVENTIWMFTDFIFIDMTKKVSINDDLEIPAYTKRRDDLPLNLTQDRLPACLDLSKYHQISNDSSNNTNDTNDTNNTNNVNKISQESRSSLDTSLLSDQYEDAAHQYDNDEIPLENISPMIPNSHEDKENDTQKNAYSIV